ncbi:hypothetical protein HSX11_02825 [Oxalobacteraceae bacterium]|nr:hypothetical protein [Oxalobacteraceae bacterium]
MPITVARIQQEMIFVRYRAQLEVNAMMAKSRKGVAALGIIEDLFWVEGKTIAAVDGLRCLGLMVIDGTDEMMEIEQWVTACGSRGVGQHMLDWLIQTCQYRKVKLLPTSDASRQAYAKLGFEKIENDTHVIWEVPPPPP